MNAELNDDDRATLRAVSHIESYHLGRAARSLASDAKLLNTHLPEIQEKLRALHPPLPVPSALPPLPNTAPAITVPGPKETREMLVNSDTGAAPGPSGWGGNMLAVLAADDICVEGLSLLMANITNGDIPDTVRPHLISCRLVA